MDFELTQKLERECLSLRDAGNLMLVPVTEYATHEIFRLFNVRRPTISPDASFPAALCHREGNVPFLIWETPRKIFCMPLIPGTLSEKEAREFFRVTFDNHVGPNSQGRRLSEMDMDVDVSLPFLKSQEGEMVFSDEYLTHGKELLKQAASKQSQTATKDAMNFVLEYLYAYAGTEGTRRARLEDIDVGLGEREFFTQVLIPQLGGKGWSEAFFENDLPLDLFSRYPHMSFTFRCLLLEDWLCGTKQETGTFDASAPVFVLQLFLGRSPEYSQVEYWPESLLKKLDSLPWFQKNHSNALCRAIEKNRKSGYSYALLPYHIVKRYSIYRDASHKLTDEEILCYWMAQDKDFLKCEDLNICDRDIRAIIATSLFWKPENSGIIKVAKMLEKREALDNILSMPLLTYSEKSWMNRIYFHSVFPVKRIAYSMVIGTFDGPADIGEGEFESFVKRHYDKATQHRMISLAHSLMADFYALFGTVSHIPI